MDAFALLLAILVATSPLPLPPMTDSQRERLALANDGGDHQEEAFLALLEHARQWKANSVGSLWFSPDSTLPSVDELLRDPAAHRGEWFVARGTLVQQSPLGPGFEGVYEWFVRDSTGRPQLVYVVNPAESVTTWRDGQKVEVVGRFYKMVQAVARDGSTQRYAAFVGRFPRLAASADLVQPVGAMWMLAVPVGALIVVFFVLSRWVRRTRQQGRSAWQSSQGRPSPLPDPLDDVADLPDDPAAALAELKRRAAADH